MDRVSRGAGRDAGVLLRDRGVVFVQHERMFATPRVARPVRRL